MLQNVLKDERKISKSSVEMLKEKLTLATWVEILMKEVQADRKSLMIFKLSWTINKRQS